MGAIDVTQLPLDLGDGIERLMRRFYPLIVSRSFGDAQGVLGVDIAFDLDNPFVQDVLGELAQQVRKITETTRAEIQALVGRQADEGWSIQRLAEEIRTHGENISKSRAEMIARSETAAAYSKGSILAYKESGVVKAVEWLATLDDQTSEECAALHGTRAELGKTFADGTEHPPRHPNCRCALIPVVE
jgi:SPP1 gp7 family putative phage head morphogenesis protein